MIADEITKITTPATPSKTVSVPSILRSISEIGDVSGNSVKNCTIGLGSGVVNSDSKKNGTINNIIIAPK